MSFGGAALTNLDLLHLTVDGSMKNPYAASAVAVWTMFLTVAAVWMVRSATRGELLARVGMFTGFVALTRPAQRLVANLLYWISDRSIVGVTFLEGPPIWIAPTVSCVVAVVLWAYIAKRRSHAS